MSAEIEEYQAYQSRSERSSMEAWADDLKAAYGVAVRLVETSFVPDSYKGKPEEAAAAIMTGQEIGLSPLAALRSIDIINGVPGMRAVALRALVQSHGHEIWVDESTTERAIVKGRRKGSDRVETSSWTMDRARGLNLVGKDNWKKQPIAMLVARATSECARLIDADGILGIPYTTEELQDLGAVEAVPDAPVKAPAKRSVRRAALPVKGEVEEPPLPDEDREPEVEPVVESGVTLVWETAPIPEGEPMDAPPIEWESES